MKLIDNMADRLRNSLRDFLQIEPANISNLTIRETLDWQGEAAKHQIWYRGDANELSQLYKHIDGGAERSMFWAAVPSAGNNIRKIHTGIPGVMVDVLVAIVMRDLNGVVAGERDDDWQAIAKDNNFDEMLSQAVSDALVIGDGAFKISYDPDMSKYPIIEFVPGTDVNVKTRRGRVTAVEFRTTYHHRNIKYELYETYSKEKIISELTKDGRTVNLHAIPQTEKIHEVVDNHNKFMIAIPFKVFGNHKWKGRGKSIFDGKTDNFDALDEAWSQWMDAVRQGRSKTYIPENMLPRNPYTGEVMRPNGFDNAYIQTEAQMVQGVANKIENVQPSIPHDSYLATYITALDLCLQGIISPSTLGIDVKKLDNADAQREKEKATLYTRNKIVEALQNILPEVVNAAIKTYDAQNKKAIKDVEVEVAFGEYANPSFESQVETVAKAKSQGIMSIEAAVDELYGDSKDEEWKKEEVERIKAEQGTATVAEPSLGDDIIE